VSLGGSSRSIYVHCKPHDVSSSHSHEARLLKDKLEGSNYDRFPESALFIET
jgi:hypothetical protein